MEKASKIVSAAVLGKDFETVFVNGKAYVIHPPTIHKIAGAGYYLSDLKDGITVMDKGRIIEEIDDISLFSELCNTFTSILMHGLPISASATQDYNFYLERFKKGDTRLVTVKPGHRIEL